MTSNDKLVQRDVYLCKWKEFINNDEALKKEFEAISIPIDDLTNKDAHMPQNEKRNRYPDLVAYDYNRVKIKDKVNGSDYINASYIKGFNDKFKYIATQAPIKDTVNEFWQMIVEQKIKVIVTLTKFDEAEVVPKSKCYPYLNDDVVLQFGNHSIKCLSKTDCGDWIERKVSVGSKNGDQHTLMHYHYTQWPDLGVPSDTKGIIDLINKLQANLTENDWPFLVHCTAGIGRTGTFLAIDQAIQMIRELNSLVEVKEIIANLRRQRISLVETWPQYKFIHQALLGYNWS